jgi:hypothetical protein
MSAPSIGISSTSPSCSMTIPLDEEASLPYNIDSLTAQFSCLYLERRSAP